MNKKICTLIFALLMVIVSMAPAMAEGGVGATVVMRVSKMTQNAVIDVGEDFSMDIAVDGAEPTAYRWYHDDALIEGATHPVYNIVNAKVEDSGIYRMDALDADDNLLVSTEISVRVTEDIMPKAGDGRLSPVWVLALMTIAGAVLAANLFDRKRA